jgi:hypothetical protein
MKMEWSGFRTNSLLVRLNLRHVSRPGGLIASLLLPSFATVVDAVAAGDVIVVVRRVISSTSLVLVISTLAVVLVAVVVVTG